MFKHRRIHDFDGSFTAPLTRKRNITNVTETRMFTSRFIVATNMDAKLIRVRVLKPWYRATDQSSWQR